MVSWQRGLATVGLTLTLAASAAACASPGGGTTNAVSDSCKTSTKISIATTPYQDSLLMTLGTKLGWYAKECLQVSFTNVDFSTTMSTLASGTTDVAWYNTTGVVSTYNRDPDLVYVYPWDIFDEGAAMMARPSVGLTTFDDFVKQGMSDDDATKAVFQELKGKNVITTLGSDTGAALQMALRRQGLPEDWVKITDLSQDQGLTLFLRGTGDVYLGGIPQRQTLVKKDYDTLIAGADLAPPPLNGFVTTKKFYDANQEAMLKLQHVTFEAIRYAQENTPEVAKYVADTFNKQTGGTMTADDFTSFFQQYEHYPLNAGEAQKDIFSADGYAYWKNIWDQDNEYLHDVTKAIPETVPTSAFLGEEFQKAYVDKYGSDETGWDKPTGSLS